ncbi:double zinc ribbon domain-containing protein [Acidocella sp.]|uniref:double zinc ribbon domain-containing protein n=1 Tax=Acidocella sp. TaxID=50710 RepID=UPI00261D67E4|nr:double zinc ribbon domain-containing protein [Acidocella sp.]
MKPLFRWILDSVLPPSCLACSETVEAEGQFCAKCFSKAEFITAPLCERCGVPFPFALEGGVCACCAASPRPMTGPARRCAMTTRPVA